MGHKFAKLFDIKDNQLLVKMDTNEDGLPEVRLFWHSDKTDDGAMASTGFVFADNSQEEWVKCQECFDKMDEATALLAANEIMAMVGYPKLEPLPSTAIQPTLIDGEFYRYWMTISYVGDIEITRDTYLKLERQCGFYPKSRNPNDHATGGFSSGQISAGYRRVPEPPSIQGGTQIGYGFNDGTKSPKGGVRCE